MRFVCTRVGLYTVANNSLLLRESNTGRSQPSLVTFKGKDVPARNMNEFAGVDYNDCTDYVCGGYTGYQKVSVHLMITILKVTSNVQSVPRHSPDIY